MGNPGCRLPEIGDGGVRGGGRAQVAGQDGKGRVATRTTPRTAIRAGSASHCSVAQTGNPSGIPDGQ
ncbi:hypothetical protein [Streptomyces ossamyceticus]|uniref:Uncharacterized protein n=1 Tax=Streptomyces ossamyceticus TaxID=249581 RepID=A0ABV2V0F6_9ACTN